VAVISLSYVHVDIHVSSLFITTLLVSTIRSSNHQELKKPDEAHRVFTKYLQKITRKQKRKTRKEMLAKYGMMNRSYPSASMA
jgi:hypothetical protein